MRTWVRIERRGGSESLSGARGMHVLPSSNGIIEESSTGLGKIATFLMTGEEKRSLTNVARFIGCLPQTSLGHSEESCRFGLIFEK